LNMFVRLVADECIELKLNVVLFERYMV